MKNCLYLTSAFSAAFFCWAVFTVSTAFGADGHEAAHTETSEHAEEASQGAEVIAGEAIAGHAAEHSSSGLPQLDVATFPSQLFWLAITFAILYVIFSRKSLPEISSVLENRAEHIRSDLETAEKLKGEAEKVQKAYESGLGQARDAATKAMNEVQDNIKAKAEQQNKAFREKADEDIKALEDRLTAAKDEAMEDMSAIAAEVASEAAKKIVGINPDPDQARRVVKALSETKAKAA